MLNQLKSEIKMYCLRNGNISIRSCKSRMISSSQNSLMQKKMIYQQIRQYTDWMPIRLIEMFFFDGNPQKKLFNTHLDMSYQNKAIPKHSR